MADKTSEEQRAAYHDALDFALKVLLGIAESIETKETRHQALCTIGTIRDCVLGIEQTYSGKEPALPDGPWINAYQAFYASAENRDFVQDMDLNEVFQMTVTELASDAANAGKSPEWCLEEAAKIARAHVAEYTKTAIIN